jgi:hypothetical protein
MIGERIKDLDASLSEMEIDLNGKRGEYRFALKLLKTYHEMIQTDVRFKKHDIDSIFTLERLGTKTEYNNKWREVYKTGKQV